MKDSVISEIIEMALSDHVSFENIKSQHNLSEKEVKLLMRRELKVGSYKAWRKRINQMGARREFYKWQESKSLHIINQQLPANFAIGHVTRIQNLMNQL